MHNHGKSLRFIKPSECRMGGEMLQLLRVMRLKETLEEVVATKVFLELKEFHFLKDVIKCDDFWDCLFTLNQTLYGFYRLLRLGDTQIGVIDKVKYYILQIDRLMPDLLANLAAKMCASDDVMGRLRRAVAHKLDKTKGGKGKTRDETKGKPKTEGLDGKLLCRFYPLKYFPTFSPSLF